MNELQKIHDAAMRRGLNEAVTALVNGFGSRTGEIDDVPAARRAALTMALEKMLANSSPKTDALMRAAFSGKPPTPRAPTLEDVRRDAMEAFGSPIAEPAAPPKSIDEKAVWAKWNRPNGKTLGDEA